MTSWLSKSQVCELTGWHPRHVERKVSSGELIARETAELAPNGRAIKEYAAASLPDAARIKLDSQHIKTSEAANVAKADALAPLFAGVAATPAVQSQRIALSSESERQAEERLQIIQPLLDFINNPGSRARFAQLRLTDGTPVTNSDRLASYLAETHSINGKKISRATIWNWKKAFATGGINALARGIRSDKGKSRWFAQQPEAAQLAASLYLKPFQTVAIVYNALLGNCERLNITAADLPSYETVRAYLDTIPKPVAVLAREGERAHSERMNAYLQRGYEDVAANQIWVSDHMIHDVFVWNDCFPTEQEGKQMRLRLTMLLDMRTRKPVGYSWTPEGSSNSIKTALRRAVAAYGPCELFYCDNGKDFKKVARGGSMLGLSDQDIDQLDQEITEIDRRGVLTRLGIPAQHCLKYHPQSKHIERFFRTLHVQFDAKFSAYTTGNAYTRTDAANVLSIHHRKLMKLGMHENSKLLPASVFIKMCAMWLEEIYSNSPHRGKGMDGLSPNQIFDAGYPVDQRRRIEPERLEELLWESKLCNVRETAITLHKRRYVATEPHGNAQLYLANEQQVRVLFDPYDLDRAVVTDLDGRKIASVQAEQLTRHSAEAQPQIAASMAERRRLRNANADSIRGLHRAVRQKGYATDIEDLYDRALALPVTNLITQRAPQTVNAEPEYTPHLHSEDIGDRLAERLSRRNNGTLG